MIAGLIDYTSWPFGHSFCTASTNCPAPWLCQPFRPPTSQCLVTTAHSYNLVCKRRCSLGERPQGQPSTGVPAWRPAITTTEYFRRHTAEKLPVRNGPKDLLLTLHRPLLVGDEVYRCKNAKMTMEAAKEVCCWSSDCTSLRPCVVIASLGGRQ